MKRNLSVGKMQSVGFSLNIFTTDELDEIHLSTLEVLEKTGLFVEDEEAMAIFDGGGAFVDSKTKVVKIPPHLVEDAIHYAPAKIFLAGRDSKNDLVLESNRIGFTNFGAGTTVVDPYTSEIRASSNEDLANSAKLVDYLDNLEVYYRALSSLDVPEDVEQLYNAKAIFPKACSICPLSSPITIILVTSPGKWLLFFRTFPRFPPRFISSDAFCISFLTTVLDIFSLTTSND